MTARIPFTPREYQSLIIDQQLFTPRCATWAGMGLGKTVSTLTAFDTLFLAGEETKPALVLAPLRVAASTWPDEAKKWQHLRNIEVQPIVGTQDQRKAALRNRNASVFTVNYDNLPWLRETLGDNWPFGAVIADESTRLKSFRLKQGSVRAQALSSIAHTRVSRWINLTGTPSPNGLQDLWGQQWFIDEGRRLGRSFEGFKQRWFQSLPTGTGYQQLAPLAHARAQIEERLRDVCLSLDARDYFDLEEPIVNTIEVDLPDRARRAYTEMERELFTSLEGHDFEAFNAAARTQKCLQLASGALYKDPIVDGEQHPRSREFIEVHDAKLQALESIVEEAAGMPVLVAYHFQSDLARLLKAFPKGRALDASPQTIRDWNAGKIPVLFAHPASAGHGLNLQDGGNILVFFSHWWDLEQYQQIIERIGPTRQVQAGHNRSVFIYQIIARDTLDETVMARRDSKRSLQDLLLHAMKKVKLCA